MNLGWLSASLACIDASISIYNIYKYIYINVNIYTSGGIYIYRYR